MKKLVWKRMKNAVGIMVMAVIMCGMTGCGSEDHTPKKVDTAAEESKEETKEEAKEPEKTVFGIGETAELDNVQVTMVNYSESAGSEYNKPADGKEFVLVQFEIANNSDKEMNVSSMMSFDAYADDYTLDYSLSALMENQDANQLDGTIAAGKKMNGVIGYEVPVDWKNIEIHFTNDVWSGNDFVFEITR